MDRPRDARFTSQPIWGRTQGVRTRHDSSNGESPPNNGRLPTGCANQHDYQVTDRLHEGRTVNVPGHEIATTVAAWLAELGAHSPLVDDLARAAHSGDWA